MNSIDIFPPAKPLAESYQMIVPTTRLTTPRKWSVEDGSLPDPQPNEILIEIKGCGLCLPSLAAWQGPDHAECSQKNGSPGKKVGVE